MIHPLHRLWFEWHDLPVDRIAITERGVTVDVCPFDDDADRYEQATLSLLDADAIEFDVQGKLSLKDLGISRSRILMSRSRPRSGSPDR